MSKHNDGKLRQSKLATRSQILERGCEMYFAHELVHGDERLSLVLDSLGYTTGAGYQIWANQASFRRDLQILIAQRLDFDSLSAAIVSCIDGVEPEQSVELLGRQLLDCILEHEGFYLSLRFLALGSSCLAEVREQLVEERLRFETALALSLERLSRRVGGVPGIDGIGAYEFFRFVAGSPRRFCPSGPYLPRLQEWPKAVLCALAALFGVDNSDLVVAKSANSRQSKAECD